MERKFYTNSFEDLLKQRSDEFRMYPSSRVWHSIYNDLHPSRRWPSVAATVGLIFALLLLGYWNNKSTKITNSLVAENHLKNKNNTSTQNFIGKTLPYTFAENLTNIDFNKNSNSKNAYHIANKEKIHITDVFNPILLPKTNLYDTISTTLLASLPTQKMIKPDEKNLKPIKETNLIASNTIKSLADVTSTNKNSFFTDNNSVNQSTVAEVNVLKDSVSNAENDIKKSELLSADEKAWIEAYALHNKSKRKKWKDRTKLNFYVTPSIGYRTLTSDSKYNNFSVTPPLAPISINANVNQLVNQKNGFGLEAGVNFNYTFAKKFRLLAGLQGNITNYAIIADNLNHPVTTNLLIVDPETGITSLKTVSSTLNNSSAIQPVAVNNKTYQFSLPIGLAYKIHGYKKLDWFVASTIQPTYVFGGTAFLISADRKNYVRDASAIHQFNFNIAAETYINYKFDGFSLQVGPQFRYQLYSTYDKKYTVKENLYNVGIKIGITKDF